MPAANRRGTTMCRNTFTVPRIALPGCFGNLKRLVGLFDDAIGEEPRFDRIAVRP